MASIVSDKKKKDKKDKKKKKEKKKKNKKKKKKAGEEQPQVEDRKEEQERTVGSPHALGPPAGASGVSDRYRTGRSAVSGRRRQGGGYRGQAPRRDRRGGTTHPVPGLSKSRPDVATRPWDFRRPGDQAAGPGPGH